MRELFYKLGELHALIFNEKKNTLGKNKTHADVDFIAFKGNERRFNITKVLNNLAQITDKYKEDIEVLRKEFEVNDLLEYKIYSNKIQEYDEQYIVGKLRTIK